MTQEVEGLVHFNIQKIFLSVASEIGIVITKLIMAHMILHVILKSP